LTHENATTRHVPQLDIGYDAEVRRFTAIPTTDSEAALEFCRSLARLLAADPSPARLD